MKKKLIVIASLIMGWASQAQEVTLPIINQYIADNPYLLSASYAGIGDCWQARFSGFEQWVGIEDAPSTQSFSIDGRIADRSGIGAVIFNDSNGFTSQKGIQASFAHHITLTQYNKQYLSFGISYKYSQFSIDSSRFNQTGVGIGGDFNSNNHNFDVSLLYRIKSFFVTANAINLINRTLKDLDETEPEELQNYYVYGGFTFDNIFKGLQFEPSALYRNFASDTRSTLDLNFKVRKFFKDSYFWGGVSVRGIIDQSFKPLSASPLLGLKKGNFYFAYGYQINTNEILQASSGGSHLITLGIDFGCRKSTCGCTF